MLDQLKAHSLAMSGISLVLFGLLTLGLHPSGSFSFQRSALRFGAENGRLRRVL
jgi:hypothetical protein